MPLELTTNKNFSKKFFSKINFYNRMVFLINNSRNLKQEKKNDFTSQVINMVSAWKGQNKTFPQEQDKTRLSNQF